MQPARESGGTAGRFGLLINRILTPAYHLLYHRLSWSYDLIAWLVSMGRWNNSIAYISSVIQSSPVLELGHGPGHLLVNLQPRISQVIGVDRSPYMSRQASRRLLKAGLSACLVNSDAHALPFPSGSFAAVVSTFPAPYIFDTQTLSEVYRLLQPGGELTILLTAWFLGRGLLKGFWRRIFGSVLEPNYAYAQLRSLFGSQPWLVEITNHPYEDNVLLIITCRKIIPNSLDY